MTLGIGATRPGEEHRRGPGAVALVAAVILASGGGPRPGGLRIQVEAGAPGSMPCRGYVALGLVGLSRPGGAALVARSLESARRPRRAGARRECPAAPVGPTAAAAGAFVLEDVGWVRRRPVARLWMDGQEPLPARVQVVYTALQGGAPGPRRHRRAAKPGPPGAGDAFAAVLRRGLLNGSSLPPLGPRDVGTNSRPLAADPPLRPGARIEVVSDGPVAVTFEALAAAGWGEAGIDVAHLALASTGRPVPFVVRDAGDGILGPGDSIEFLGRGMTGPYTRRNVYWLTADGGAAGYSRRGVQPMGPGVEAAPVFPGVARFEVDSVFVQSPAGRNAPDRWFWGPAVASGGRVIPFDLPGLAAGGAGGRLELRVLAYGAAAGEPPRLTAAVNGGTASVFRLGEGAYARLSMDLGAEVLSPTGNELALTMVQNGGRMQDLAYLDGFDVLYPALFRARGDLARFDAVAGAEALVVGPFSGRRIRVLDVTDPLAPVELYGFSVGVSNAGGYEVAFTDAPVPGPGPRYLAYGAPALRPPARVATDDPSDWAGPGAGADWVAIVHPDLEDAVMPLAARRRAQGLKTAVVSVTDVYDEFSGGVFDPRALRAFVAHALAHWDPAPTFVVLVGDAALDHRNEYGTGWRDLVPSMQVDLDTGAQATSDLYFATVAGDDALPDVFIGRIPAISPADVATAVAKIVAFEDRPPGPWLARATFVAGSWRGAAANEAGAEALISSLPAGVAVRRIWGRDFSSAAGVKVALADAVAAGSLDVSYVGHGNAGLWKGHGVGRVLDSAGMGDLATAVFPILTTATCRNGFIDAPYAPVALAEAWLLAPGAGGAAAWSPSGEEFTANHLALLEPFHRRLHAGGARTLGAATAEAALVAYGVGSVTHDVIRQFVLVGDPAMILPPAPPAGGRICLPWLGSPQGH